MSEVVRPDTLLLRALVTQFDADRCDDDLCLRLAVKVRPLLDYIDHLEEEGDVNLPRSVFEKIVRVADLLKLDHVARVRKFGQELLDEITRGGHLP